MPKRIYIVEDDATLASELQRLLELDGYEAITCKDFARAADLAVLSSPDCVLLDLKLPGADGREICRDIRRRSNVPVIVLTSVDDEFTEVTCLRLGADDFVTKPYRPAALLARVAAVIQRSAPAETAAVIEHRGVRLDLNTSEVSLGLRKAQLTRNEQRILSLLMRRAGSIVSRQEIMCDLWESDEFIGDNTLTVNVNRLRKALASIGVPDDFLQTRRAQGYVVAP